MAAGLSAGWLAVNRWRNYASYATGNANGGSSSAVDLGALVGENSGEIIASYATGDADGG